MKGEAMQILFAEQQPCIRALKYAEAIYQYPDITLMFVYRGKTLTELYGHGDELFAAWFPLSDDPVREQERLAIERSNAVIAVSDETINIARQHYQLPDLTYVFPNYIPRRFVPKRVLKRNDRSQPIRIVYEGFMSNNLGHYDLGLAQK